MGCDIHMMLEHQPYTCSKTWDALTQETYHGRAYGIFAKLAGVRGNGPAPKGLPPDVSEGVLTALSAMGSDAHSVSYADVGELKAAIQGNEDYGVLGMYFGFVAMMEVLEKHKIPVRAVYWFDN